MIWMCPSEMDTLRELLTYRLMRHYTSDIEGQVVEVVAASQDDADRIAREFLDGKDVAGVVGYTAANWFDGPDR